MTIDWHLTYLQRLAGCAILRPNNPEFHFIYEKEVREMFKVALGNFEMNTIISRPRRVIS